MKKSLPLILCLCAFYNIAFTQSYKAYTEKAEEAVANRNYTAALSYYHFLVTEAGRESIENYHQAAESARKTRIYDLAEVYYQRVADLEDGKTAHPLTEYWLADVEKRQGKYYEAKAHFEAFVNGPGSANSFYAEKARKEIEACEWAIQLTEDPDKIEIEHLDEPVNSELTDIAPFKYNGKLFFTSIRDNYEQTQLEKEQGSVWIERMAEDDKTINDISLTTVLVKDEEEEKGTSVSEFDAFREKDLHVAHIAFTNEGKKVIYTLCKQVNFTDTECKLYFRDQDEQEKWGPKVAFPDFINKTGYTTTQPTIGKDKATKKDILFFASNRPDGIGKMDIWYTHLESDSICTQPKNVSTLPGGERINTEDNDITPHWDEVVQTLFFSSEGHKNMGSFDIYKVKKSNNGFGKVQHLGYPMNSSYDDTYYTISDDGKEAFFSSNRPGNLCASGDSLCTCSDIYKVEMPKLKLEVLTFNSITGEPLLGTAVNLENIISQFTDTDLNDTSNYFTFGIDYENEYDLQATKEGYIKDEDGFSTLFERTDTTIKVRMDLTPQVDLNTFTFDKSTGENLNGVKVELILQPKSATIDSNNVATTNEYNFGLDYYNQYMVVATKPGYTSDTAYVRTDNIAIIPTTLLANLYLCKGLDPFPDISLYFDNDYPSPDTEDPITELTYGETAEAYLDNKKDFLKKYRRNSDSYKQVEAFFDNEVEGGLEKLDAFAQRIYDYFASTDNPNAQVNITIQGNASKLSNERYNFFLTKRRVSSLRNHLREWTNGSQSMKPYYPRIFVTEKPLGDTRSTTSQKTPIVDLVASKERRVDIQSVSVTGQCDPNPLKGNTPLTSKSPIKLRVLTFDEITGEPLSGTTVDFASITYPKESRTNMESHTYSYDISREIIYSIVATKPGYTKATKSYFSGDGTGANPAEVRLYLSPKTPTSGDIKMRILTFHELTGEPLPGATVNVMSGKSTAASVSKNINDYTYLYNANWKTNYKIEGKKPGYTLSRKEVYTKPDIKLIDNTVEVKLYMRPTVDLTALIYDVNGNAALNDVKVELILLPQTRTLRTQQLADMNAYDYELDFKQSYMVVASKYGYTSDTTYVSTKDIPMEPTTLQTKLYLCKYMPMPGNIPLYFDNDHPNPDTEQTTTELTYQQTFEDYLANRNYFEKKFSKGTKGYNEMNRFFEDDVKNGMARLNDFAQELYSTLSTTDETTTIEITIQGHASLRSNRSYNMALTKRRIGSLENYLRTWNKDGQNLGQYYNRLIIKEVPRGEEEACEDCYHRMSIRDIKACRDRRVDIIAAKVLNACGSKPNRPGK